MRVISAVLLGCVLSTAAASNTTLSFLAIGDWGGSSDSKPTTRGEVDNNQAMGTVAQKLGDVRFVMAMGDNFYTTGVSNEYSKRFTQTFEDVFSHSALQLPWYVVAGNHDHYGNVTAQIAYTADSPSQRWKFPSLYYTFQESFVGTSGKTVQVQVIYLDSVVISGMSYHDEETGEFVKGEGPADKALAATQMEWLEAQLKASTADYLFVSAHYPIYSQCEHGPTKELQQDVLPLLKQYKATAYLAGHDHCLGHFEDAGLMHMLSGAGKECCYKPTHAADLPDGIMKFHMDHDQTYGANGGFASVSLTESSGHIVYYDENGKTLYTSASFSPRN
eukprot:TRINITY_DN90_c0_g1_i1.p1 TRINITY_DN90_c0_g1~~TRINITY_DN90_c0_g1_i1.p1  ORF type:complete len:348 (+),score=153.74 TRINITY_DN90_c0_g1_i1:48-1046(+)